MLEIILVSVGEGQSQDRELGGINLLLFMVFTPPSLLQPLSLSLPILEKFGAAFKSAFAFFPLRACNLAFSILLTETLYYTFLFIYFPASKSLLLCSGFSHTHENFF